MVMEIVNVQQGSKEWLDLRMGHFTASEAPAMMGKSKHQTRDELLAMKKTGISPEVSPVIQSLFDRGHEAETAIRPHIEKMISRELYPATGTESVDGLPLLASFDGLTMLGDTVFEHKLWNEKLAEMVHNDELSEHYTIQLDQQLLVSGAKEAIFVVSDGTTDKVRWTWYSTTPEKKLALINGWKQFSADLADYVPVVAAVEPVAAPTCTLPAIQYNLNGLQITSNLAEYSAAAKRLVDDSKLPMTTDQEFADAELRNKALRKAVKSIADVCERVIQEVSDIYQFRETLQGIGEQLRQAALNGEKQVKARKEQMRFEIINEAKGKLADHCAELEDEFGNAWLSGYVQADFAGAAKGKSKLSSVQSAVNDELARAKIEADAVARKIRANLKTLKEDAGEYRFLFADVSQIIYKDPEDFGALVRDRVASHKAEEERKEDARKAEQERKDQAEKQRMEAEQKNREEMSCRSAEGNAIIHAARGDEIKCDGNHGGPQCGDKECWNDDVQQSYQEMPKSEKSNIGIEIVDSLVSNGIPPGPAARVAQLIVDGKVARVYCK